MESNEQDQLLIEADLAEETGQEQDEWMSAMAPHAATDVYESADDYDELEFVRQGKQQDWLQDCKNTRNDSNRPE